MEKINEESGRSSPAEKLESSPDKTCHLMQQIGLPALRLAPVSLEVLAFNGLFADLMDAGKNRDYRLWFVEGVLPSLGGGEKESWVAKTARTESAQVAVQFTSRGNRRLYFEMRSTRLIERGGGQSIICVFISSFGGGSRKPAESAIAKGREMERSRIRDELHGNVSQKLLGAAFGCKLLAGKIGGLNENLATQASELAELLNTAVVDLQNLTRANSEGARNS